MNIWLTILIGFVVLVVGYWLLSTFVGLFFAALIAAVIGALVLALARSWMRGHQARKAASPQAQRRTDQSAERALKDLERKINRQ